MRTNHNASGKPSLEGCVGLRYPLRWVLQATYPWVCGILTGFFPFFFLYLYIQYAGFRRQQNTKPPLPANTSANTTALLQAKKEAPHSRHFRLHSKNFCLQELFPSACSIHAFISAASVLKSFSRTASTSSSLCRPNFR